MDAKTLNALVHDRESAFYDDRFLIDYDRRIARDVRRDLSRLLGTPLRAERALDVACGTGYIAIGLSASGLAREVHATDLSPAMLGQVTRNAARTGSDIRLALADAEYLPYAASSFDLVLARGALHHVPEPLAALREIRRVLRPGGTAIVLAEPTPAGERQVAAVVGLAVRALEGLRRLARRKSDDVHRHWELASIAANLHTFEPSEIGRLAEKAGFEEINVSTASWAWILTLGLNYYLAGELPRVADLPGVRRASRAAADIAALFDRTIAETIFPASWLHTVQAVLR